MTKQKQYSSVEEMLDDMDVTYLAESHRRRKWVKTHYGARCADFSPDCIICAMWQNQDEFEAMIDRS